MGSSRLSRREAERYNRQMIIKGWGEEGQRKLKRAKVAVIGLGGLGSPASIYLAAAGVGKLLLVDEGEVELSNLNRQILHWERDVGKPKVESAKEKIEELNPEVEVETLMEKIGRDNVHDVVREVDLVVDGLDNFSSRVIVNRACVEEGKVFVHAGVYGFQGQLTTIIPGKGPCLQCIFPRLPPEEGLIPVAGMTPGVMGCLEANEAVKVVTGIGEPLVGRLLIYDGEAGSFMVVDVGRDPDCPVCGKINL